VYPDYIELLMGYKLDGVRKHHHMPPPEVLLEGTKANKGYIDAIDALTINSIERERLEKAELTSKIKSQEDIKQDLAKIKNENKSLQNQIHLIIESMQKRNGMKTEYQKKFLVSDFKKMGMYFPPR